MIMHSISFLYDRQTSIDISTRQTVRQVSRLEYVISVKSVYSPGEPYISYKIGVVLVSILHCNEYRIILYYIGYHIDCVGYHIVLCCYHNVLCYVSILYCVMLAYYIVLCCQHIVLCCVGYHNVLCCVSILYCVVLAYYILLFSYNIQLCIHIK